MSTFSLKDAETIQANLKSHAIKGLQYTVHCDGVVIAHTEDTYFLIILNKNLKVISTYSAAREKVYATYIAWERDVDAGVRHPTVKIELLGIGG